MNKKKILTTLSIAAVAIVSGYGGMKAYQSHVANNNDLLMRNIEALSNDEMPILSECMGLDIYEVVGVAYSEKTVRYHKSDSSDYDCVEVYATRSCFANGRGTSNGFNGPISITIKDRREEKCIGATFHNSLY